jgi:hypothetical protein
LPVGSGYLLADPTIVMAGLVPAIHGLFVGRGRAPAPTTVMEREDGTHAKA